MGFKTVLDGKALENLNLWCRIQFGHNFNQSGAFPVFSFLISLEGMVPYADQLLAPAEGLGQGFFLAKKKAHYAVLANVSPFLVFSSNLSKFL